MPSYSTSTPAATVRTNTTPSAADYQFWIKPSTNEGFFSDGTSWTEIPTGAPATAVLGIENALNILELQIAETITPDTSAQMVCDIFVDADGHNNSVDTGNTTAKFTTNKYQNLSSIIDNLLVYYKLDETSGTDVIDSSNGNNGTNSGCSVNQTGLLGESYEFSSGDNIATTLSLSGDFSFSCWVYLSGLPAGGTYYCLYSSGLSPWIGISETGAVKFHLNNGTYSADTGASKVSAGSWQHICVTLSETTPHIYVNGVDESLTSSGTPTAPNISGFTIGKKSDQATNYFIGKMDEVALFSSAISQSDVTTIFNTGSGKNLLTNYSDKIVQTSKIDLPSTPSKFIIFSFRDTFVGTGNIDGDISFDNGANYQTGISLNTETSITDLGDEMILKLNLNAGASAGKAETQGYGVLFW